MWLNPIDTFVFPYQCDKVFYNPVHEDENWLYVIDVAPCATPIFDHANTLTVINKIERSMREYEGQDYEEDMVVSKEDYNDLSSTESNLSSSSGSSHFNSIHKGIHVANIDGKTTSQSTIGLTLEVCLEIDGEDM